MASLVDTRKFAGQTSSRLLGRLAFQMNATMKSPDADAVHDLRVAIRRFSQSLIVFKDCFPGKEKRKIRRRLKRLMTLAGTARNYDVTLKLLAKSPADHSALRAAIAGDRRQASRALVSALKRRIDRKSSMKWRAGLEAALSASDVSRQTDLGAAAGVVLPKMAREFLELGSEAAESKAPPEKLHQFRIASKKFRYSLELFEPVYGAPVKWMIEEIKHAQNILGDVNDCVSASEIVLSYKDGHALTRWIQKRQARKMEEFRRWWPEKLGDPETGRLWVRQLRHPVHQSTARKKPMAQAATLRQAAVARAR